MSSSDAMLQSLERPLSLWFKNSDFSSINISDCIEDQATSNLRILSLSEKERQNLDISSLVKLTTAIQQAWFDIVRSLKSPFIFYMWADELADQLRFCVVSGTKETLPFNCPITFEDTPENICRMFLSSDSGGVVPYSKLEEVDDKKLEENMESKYSLLVYAVEMVIEK